MFSELYELNFAKSAYSNPALAGLGTVSGFSPLLGFVFDINLLRLCLWVIRSFEDELPDEDLLPVDDLLPVEDLLPVDVLLPVDDLLLVVDSVVLEVSFPASFVSSFDDEFSEDFDEEFSEDFDEESSEDFDEDFDAESDWVSSADFSDCVFEAELVS